MTGLILKSYRRQPPKSLYLIFSFCQKIVHLSSGLLKKQTQFATQPDKYNRVHYFVIEKKNRKEKWTGNPRRDLQKKIVNQLLEFENVASF